MRALLFVMTFLFLRSALACEPLAKRKTNETGCYEFSFQSKSLNRTVEGNVYIPSGIAARIDAHSTRVPYAIFLHGRGGDRNELNGFGVISALDRLPKSVPLMIFAVSGGDHYWMNAARSKEKWGDLITQDLVKYVEDNFNVIQGNPNARALFGISMGAAGVLQLGFHAPTVFSTGAAMSLVIRREIDIWKPNTASTEPPIDYDSFGTGADFRERNPHDLCEKLRRPNGSCLPYRDFRLDAGESDPLLDRFPDSRFFIGELKKSHPGFAIEIGRCPDVADPTATCRSPADCNGHSYQYWSCMLPGEIRWLAEHLHRRLKIAPSANATGTRVIL